MGLIAKKSVMWLDGLLTFKAAPNLWRGEESWRLNQLPMASDVINHANVMACLCNGASIKTPKDRACRASGLVNNWRFGENRWLQECMEAPHPFHMHLFNLVSPKLYPFIGSDGRVCLQWRRPSLIPGLGRSPGEGNGNPFQYSCLENPLDAGACQATVRRVARSRTRLNDFALMFSNLMSKQVSWVLGAPLANKLDSSKGLWQPPNCSWLVRAQLTTWACNCHLGAGVSLLGLNPQPVESDAISG